MACFQKYFPRLRKLKNVFPYLIFHVWIVNFIDPLQRFCQNNCYFFINFFLLFFIFVYQNYSFLSFFLPSFINSAKGSMSWWVELIQRSLLQEIKRGNGSGEIFFFCLYFSPVNSIHLKKNIYSPLTDSKFCLVCANFTPPQKFDHLFSIFLFFFFVALFSLFFMTL